MICPGSGWLDGEAFEELRAELLFDAAVLGPSGEVAGDHVLLQEIEVR